MKPIKELKQELAESWKTLAQGWRQARERATTAMTRFKPSGNGLALPRLPEAGPYWLAAPDWGLLAGDVFEDRDSVVVRLEVPGMERDDFDIHVESETLHIRGDKRSSHESADGSYRMLECAYGTFERSIRLPAAVHSDRAKATYRNGVLRIVLPKKEPSEPRRLRVPIH